ncbi:MAG: hypothetical protein ABIH89_06965, partial [Elusimicrobiota bacterium]
RTGHIDRYDLKNISPIIKLSQMEKLESISYLEYMMMSGSAGSSDLVFIAEKVTEGMSLKQISGVYKNWAVEGTGDYVPLLADELLRIVPGLDARPDILKNIDRFFSGTGLKHVEVGDRNSYSPLKDSITLDRATAAAVMQLYMADKAFADKALKAVTTVIMAAETEPSALEKIISARFADGEDKIELLSMVLWFDILSSGAVHSDMIIRKYIETRLKGFSPAKKERVAEEVKKINGAFIGKKRYVKPASTGMIEVKEAKKTVEKAQRAVHIFVNIIRSLANIARTGTLMPAALALTAADGDTGLDSIAAYALGEKRAKSLMDLLSDLAAKMDTLPGRKADMPKSLISDFLVREILEAT